MIFKIAFVIGSIITIICGASGASTSTVLTLGAASFLMLILENIIGVDGDKSANGVDIHTIYYIIIVVITAALMFLSTKIPGNLYNTNIKIKIDIKIVYALYTASIFVWMMLYHYIIFQAKVLDKKDSGHRTKLWRVGLAITGFLIIITINPISKLRGNITKLEELNNNTIQISEIDNQHIRYTNGLTEDINKINGTLKINTEEHSNEIIETQYLGLSQLGESIVYITFSKIQTKEIFVDKETYKKLTTSNLGQKSMI